MSKIHSGSEIVIVNQAVNYLTIGICNAFSEHFKQVTLVTGSIHEQGEALKKEVEVTWINKWVERPALKKMTSYVKACLIIYWTLLFRHRKSEVLFISIPPMAYLLSIILPNRCSVIVWDVYPDMFKITGMTEKNILYRVWGFLNKVAFQRMYKVFTIGEKLSDLVSQYVKHEKIEIVNIWSIFQEDASIPDSENIFLIKHNIQDKFIVQYSGNIGLSHNVEVLVEIAEKMKNHDHILFQIIGRGPRMPYLKKLVDEKNLPNCMFLPFQADEMFPYSLSAADLGVVILDSVTSKGSVPSKSYNLMSFGIPSLYIASTESELYEYSRKYKHAECFEAHALSSASEFILELSHDSDLYMRYKQNALQASGNFRRKNANIIADKYFKEDNKTEASG